MQLTDLARFLISYAVSVHCTLPPPPANSYIYVMKQICNWGGGWGEGAATYGTSAIIYYGTSALSSRPLKNLDFFGPKMALASLVAI